MIQVSRDISEELASNKEVLNHNAILSSVLNGTRILFFIKIMSLETVLNEEWIRYLSGVRVLLSRSKPPLYDNQGRILGGLLMILANTRNYKAQYNPINKLWNLTVTALSSQPCTVFRPY